jgi:hypothetical protein
MKLYEELEEINNTELEEGKNKQKGSKQDSTEDNVKLKAQIQKIFDSFDLIPVHAALSDVTHEKSPAGFQVMVPQRVGREFQKLPKDKQEKLADALNSLIGGIVIERGKLAITGLKNEKMNCVGDRFQIEIKYGLIVDTQYRSIGFPDDIKGNKYFFIASFFEHKKGELTEPERKSGFALYDALIPKLRELK